MSRVSTRLPAIAALLLLVATSAAADGARRAGVAGKVAGESSPLRAAGVYAYQLADLTWRKVLTDANGAFLFQDLPAGLYKIVAHKPGFVPVVVLVTRSTAQTYQYLDLQLAEQEPGSDKAPRAGEDFWSLRSQVPSDVLRDIERGIEDETHRIETASLAPFGTPGINGIDTGKIDLPFRTDLQAMTGFDQIDADAGMVSGGNLGIAGKLGQTEVGVEGKFFQFGSGFQEAGAASSFGQTRSLAFDLKGDEGERFNVNALNNRWSRGAAGGEAGLAPVDFEHYRLSWTHPLGESSHSDFTAQYTTENNFHHQGSNDPIDIPEASRSWRVEGSYTTSLGSGSTMQTGLRYRERQFGLSDALPRGLASEPQSNLDAFGRGGFRLEPTVLVEYGMYTTLADGSLAITPQGGLVLRLSQDWQIEASASRRAYQQESNSLNAVRPGFLPYLYGEGDPCEEGSESCYEMRLARDGDDDNRFSVEAAHRTVDETLRLYFNDNFFDRQESLYLVPGDKIPELRLSMSRKPWSRAWRAAAAGCSWPATSSRSRIRCSTWSPRSTPSSARPRPACSWPSTTSASSSRRWPSPRATRSRPISSASSSWSPRT
jgi:Carboxypeptidase regulatory-like domain